MSERIRVPHGMTPPRRRGDLITSSVSLPVDEEGFFGRECPDTSCRAFFKLEATEYATARASGVLTCPTCGQTAREDSFWTRDQIRRASVAQREFALGAAEAIFRDAFKGLGTGRSSGLTVTFRPGPARIPRSLPTSVEQATVRTFTCPTDGHRAVLYDRVAACPYCGPDTPRRAILDDALAVQSRLLDALGHLPEVHRAEVLASGGERAQAERCLTGTVAAVQSFAKDVYAGTGKAVTVRNPWQSPDRLREQWLASFGADPFTGPLSQAGLLGPARLRPPAHPRAQRRDSGREVSPGVRGFGEGRATGALRPAVRPRFHRCGPGCVRRAGEGDRLTRPRRPVHRQG